MRTRTKVFIVLFLIAAAVFGVWLFFKSNVETVIMSISEATVSQMTASAVNDAVYSSLPAELKYADLIDVTLSSDGRVTMLAANSMKINSIARTAAKRAEENLAAVSDQRVYVPIGAFTGSPLLAGVGSEIEVRVVPVGTVTGRFFSEFESAGINQTRHKIYLEINAEVEIVLPVSGKVIETVTEVLICESVLVGEVPEFYFGGGGSLDLVP